MSGKWDDEATFEAITLAAAAEAFDEYEARERAARARPRPAIDADNTQRIEIPPTFEAAEQTARVFVGAAPRAVLLWLHFARSADYFAILGLPRTAGDDDVVRERDRALAALAEVERELADRARAIIEEASAVLGDRSTRAAYARNLSAPGNPGAIFWLPDAPRRT